MRGRPVSSSSSAFGASARYLANRRVTTSCIDATSSCPSTPFTAKRRYSDFRASPSSKTTIEATTAVPCRLETSKHSMRSGASSSSSASWISASAFERAVRSLARFVLCSAKACWALRSTVSMSAFLSPRWGIRNDTLVPRSSCNQVVIASASGGSAGTSTSRGTSAPTCAPGSRRGPAAA